jgi:uncharacterized membrane protein HdeD (DUF308 family)
MTNKDMTMGAIGEIREHCDLVHRTRHGVPDRRRLRHRHAALFQHRRDAVVGWTLIIVGAIQLIQSWSIRTWGGFIWQLVIGLIILAGGISMIVDPIVATVTLTLLVGVIFIAKGIVQLVLGFRFRPNANWGWIVAAGMLAVILGLMILAQWPFTGVWVLGTLAGISLIFSGWSYVMIAMAARSDDLTGGHPCFAWSPSPTRATPAPPLQPFRRML